jgi:hypothetical protein
MRSACNTCHLASVCTKHVPSCFCTSSELGVLATVAAMKQIDLDPKLVEDVVFGNVSQTAVDTPYRKQAAALQCPNQATVFTLFRCIT